MIRLVFVFASVFLSYAVHAETIVYRFGATSLEFWNFPEKRILVSASCVDKGQLAKCAALDALKSVSFSRAEIQVVGGANPGALICEQQFEGIVLVGLRQNANAKTKNENSFCKLSDGSMIDDGSLVFFGINNDKERAKETREIAH